MSDLQEMWNDIPEGSLSEKEIENPMNGKSVSELDRFKRVLKWEVYISGFVLVILWITHLLSPEMIKLVGTITIIGWVLNLFTLWKLNQIEPLQGVRQFLTKCIRALRYFVIAYFITIQMVGGIVTVLMKSWKAPGMEWMEWLSSADGLWLLLLLAIINVVLIAYMWMFYIRRIRALKRLLDEVEEY